MTTTHRADRTDKGGGLLQFVREHLPAREINIEFSTNIKAIVIEINLKKRKWLLIGTYNPHKNMIDDHLNSLGNCQMNYVKQMKISFFWVTLILKCVKMPHARIL